MFLFTNNCCVFQSITLRVVGFLQEQESEERDSSCDHADDIHGLEGASDFLNLCEHPHGRARDDNAQRADDLVGMHELLAAIDVTEYGRSQVGDAAGCEGNADNSDIDEWLEMCDNSKQHGTGHNEIGEGQTAAGNRSTEFIVNDAPQEGDNNAKQRGKGQVPDRSCGRHVELQHHDNDKQAHKATHDPQPTRGADGDHPHFGILQQLSDAPHRGFRLCQNFNFFLGADQTIWIQAQLVGTSAGCEQEHNTKCDDDDTKNCPDGGEIIYAAGSGIDIRIGQGDHVNQEIGEEGSAQRCGHSIDAHNFSASGDIPVGDNTLHGKDQHATGHVVNDHGNEKQGEVCSGRKAD